MFLCIATKPLNDGTNGFRFNFIGIKGLVRVRKPRRATSNRWGFKAGPCMNTFSAGRFTVAIEQKQNKKTKRKVCHFAG